MKNNLIKTVIFLIAVTFVTLQSCEKKAIVPGDETGIVKNDVVNADKKADLLTGNDINWILSNPDKEDMNVDKNSYYLGIALTEIVKNKAFLQDIEEHVKNSQLQIYPFDEFISQKNTVETEINNKLKNANLSAITNEKENLNYVTISDNFRYKSISYKPVIFIPNLKHADFSLPVIVSPGIEVKDIPEKGIENAIIAWKLNAENEWEEFLLTEDDAMKNANPVLIISLSTEKQIENEKTKKMICYDYYASSKNNNKEVKSGNSYRTDKFKITYNYERSGGSEFELSSMREFNDGSVEYVYTNERIANVKRKDVGKDLSSNKTIGYKASDCTYLIFNTFEFDWYTTNKNLGRLNGWYLNGQMKYNNEWYAFDPSVNTESNPWKLGGTKYRYSKGYVKTIGTFIP